MMIALLMIGRTQGCIFVGQCDEFVLKILPPRYDEEVLHDGGDPKREAPLSRSQALDRYASPGRRGDIMFVKDWLGHANIQNTLVHSKLNQTPPPCVPA